MNQQHEFAVEEAADRSILTTWTLSFVYLQEKSEESANLLILWAFLDNQDIWYELFTAALDHSITDKLPEWFSRCICDKFAFRKCTRLLIRYSFVGANAESSSFSVHAAIHRWCFYNSGRKKVDMAWLAVVIVASTTLSEPVIHYSPLQRRLLPHCDRVCSFINHNTLDGISKELSLPLSYACNSLGALYFRQVSMLKAETMYLRALAEKETILGQDHSSTLITANNLGLLYKSQGRTREAEAMSLKALVGLEKAAGPNHPVTLQSMNNLANFYSDQDKMPEAEAMYLRTLSGQEKTLGPEHVSTLHTVNDLGLFYSEQGKMPEAEALCLRALSGQEKAWGPEHPFTLDIVDNLGVLYSKQLKIPEAEAMYLRALSGKEKALGSDDISTLDTRYHLALLFFRINSFQDAINHLEPVVQGYTKLLGPEAEKTANASQALELCQFGYAVWGHGVSGDVDGIHYSDSEDGRETDFDGDMDINNSVYLSTSCS